jgi:histidinol-phosphate aminotransferase
MTNRPQPRESILAISPYVPGRSSADGSVRTVKLSSNENPFGASPKAQAAFQNSASSLSLYPDGSATVLREAIGARYHLNPEQIVCGAGSDEILNLLAQGYLQAGDEAIYTEHGFLVYPIAIMAAGAVPVKVKETDLHADVDAILAAVTDKTRMVFLANPNNPTGTYLPRNAIERLHRGLPNRVLLVLDAAYAEYLQEDDFAAGDWMVDQAENVVMTRTFSKVYGLAQLRLGWCYGPPHLIEILHRIRGPFNVSGAAIATGMAALSDQQFVDKSVVHNTAWLARLPGEMAQIGLKTTPSVGNFLLIHFPETAGQTAADADEFLAAHGYVLRRIDNYGLPNALRMTIGTDAENLGVIELLRDFVAR